MESRTVARPLTGGVAGLLLAAGLAVVGLGAPAVAAEEGDFPLSVTITELTPSSLDLTGESTTESSSGSSSESSSESSSAGSSTGSPSDAGAAKKKADPEPVVTIRGRVTNDDDVPWWNIHAYAFMGSYPMTSATEISYAASSSTDLQVGARLLDLGDFDIVGALDPGESARYRITLPVSHLPVDLTSTSGAYWFGVHALGENWAGRVDGADGMARTFLPVMTAADPPTNPVQVALISDVRRDVRYGPTGSLNDEAGWLADLRRGSLHRVTTRADDADTTPVTWVVDPAVVDAVSRLSVGNPGRTLRGSANNSSDAGADTGAEASTVAPTRLQRRAAAWLSAMATLPGNTLALPYGDPNLVAAAEADPDLVALARRSAVAVLDAQGIRAEPAAAPPTGVLDDAGLDLVDDGVVVLSDQGVVRTAADGTEATLDAGAVAAVGETTVLTTSSAVASGGPGPSPAKAVLAVRQRLLAEAAVRALDSTPQPLVVDLPDRADDAFFTSLEVDWIAPVSIAGLDAEPVEAELSAAGIDTDIRPVLAARDLIDAGAALQDVFPTNTTLASEITDEALTAASYAREAQFEPGATARASQAVIGSLLAAIHLEAPDSVTLASNSGRFAVTIVNDLDQPVSVQLHPLDAVGLSFDLPGIVDIPAQGAATVLVTAHAERSGRHNVTLELTGATGIPTGASAQVPIRAAEVSGIIWLVIGLGLGLLAIAIGLRLFRKFRDRGQEPV
ncbi:DUF6049 family protein [soil metagenome]